MIKVEFRGQILAYILEEGDFRGSLKLAIWSEVVGTLLRFLKHGKFRRTDKNYKGQWNGWY